MSVLTYRTPRPTENQGLFMFTGADGSWRRICHTLPAQLTCWNFVEFPSFGHYSK